MRNKQKQKKKLKYVGLYLGNLHLLFTYFRIKTNLSKKVKENDVFFFKNVGKKKLNFYFVIVLSNTQSGGVCVNDCLMHQAGKKEIKKCTIF